MRRNVTLLSAVAFYPLMAVAAACVGDDPVNPSSADDASTEAAASDAAASDAPTEGAVPSRVLQIEAGGQIGCAVLADRTVWCWGSNTYGETGAPLSDSARPPSKVQGIDGVRSISTGLFSVCALKMDSTVWCWGRNTESELGRPGTSDPACGTARCNPVPTQVPQLLASQVVVGDSFGCAISPPRAEVTCWGRNMDGQTGRAASDPTAPAVILGLTNIVRIRLGFEGRSVCALDTAGLVWCWGKNDGGQLGHTPGALGDKSYADGYYNEVPQKVTTEADGGGAPFDRVTDLVATQTVCAVRADGSVWCWGRNGQNELNLTHADALAHPKPVQIAPVSGAIAVRAGRAVCALVDGGAPWCWGADVVAAGGGSDADAGCTTASGAAAPCYAPARVPGPALSSLSVYASLAFGLTVVDGTPVGWGINTKDSRLGHAVGTAGDDDAGDNPTPTPVLGLP